MAAHKRLIKINCVFALILVSYVCSQSQKDDDFFEELYIKPLQSGHVFFDFQFTTKWNASVQEDENSNFRHFRLFPKSLGDVLRTYQVQELHLTQTQGKWRHLAWGYPVDDAPAGAQLWVWFKPSVTNVDHAWRELVSSLSGLFCSSLNFLDAKATVAPRWSFRPRGAAPRHYASSSQHVRYGALPREIVCTENLTPWKKLLPCDSKTGLASLFKAEKLLDADYHSLALHFRHVCVDMSCKSPAVELVQSLSLVLDAMLHNNGYPNWGLRQVLGTPVMSHCPLASSSLIMVDTSSNASDAAFGLSPAPCRRVELGASNGVRQLAVYDVRQQLTSKRSLNIQAAFAAPLVYTPSRPPPIHMDRYMTGYGLEKGGVSCLIYNTLDVQVPVVYMDTFPWFTRLFFRSLLLENSGTSVPYKAHYIPGRDRQRPYLLELTFTLAPRSVTKLSVQFERAFLKWTEYPPDANHGFYVNSAVLSMVLPAESRSAGPAHNTSTLQQILWDLRRPGFLQLYTTPLLVSLPTPDFSMPYNVICLACTVLAIAFGSIHNLTTRRFVLLDPSQRKGLLPRLKRLFRREKGGEIKGEEKEGEAESPGGEKRSDEADSGTDGVSPTEQAPDRTDARKRKA